MVGSGLCKFCLPVFDHSEEDCQGACPGVLPGSVLGVEGSLADEPNAKPYARHAARRALNSYLQERGIAAHAEACPQNAESHRVVYQPPDPLPRVTIVMAVMTPPETVAVADAPLPPPPVKTTVGVV